MNILEKDLEYIIYSADKDKLHDRGLCLYGKIKRQLYIGNYGIADIVTFQRQHDNYDYAVNNNISEQHLLINVVELKKDSININSFIQGIRYIKGISSYIKQRKPNINLSFALTLIGRNIDVDDSFCYITDLIGCDEGYYDAIRSFEIYTYQFDAIEGISFNQKCGYKLRNEGFNLKSEKPF